MFSENLCKDLPVRCWARWHGFQEGEKETCKRGMLRKTYVILDGGLHTLIFKGKKGVIEW